MSRDNRMSVDVDNICKLKDKVQLLHGKYDFLKKKPKLYNIHFNSDRLWSFVHFVKDPFVTWID